jgi:hypothetical protein
MALPEKKLIQNLNDVTNHAELYQEKFITRSNPKSDPTYSERLAAIIYDQKISEILSDAVFSTTARDLGYFQKQHRGIFNPPVKESNSDPRKTEKRLAIALFNTFGKDAKPCTAKKYKQPYTLQFLDYEVPLKASGEKADNRGKIDLVAMDENNGLCLVELKPPESKESLLRAALEIFTYGEDATRKENLITTDFQKSHPEINNNPPRKIILIGRTSEAGITATHLDQWPSQKILYRELGIEIFVYDASDLSPLKFKSTSNKFKPVWDIEFPIKQVFDPKHH